MALDNTKMDLLNQITKIMRSFILNIHFEVKVDEELSSRREVIAGVPQGSIGMIYRNMKNVNLPFARTTPNL